MANKKIEFEFSSDYMSVGLDKALEDVDVQIADNVSIHDINFCIRLLELERKRRLHGKGTGGPVVHIGEVKPLPASRLTKDFVLKMQEEACEVYSAWEDLEHVRTFSEEILALGQLVYECGDVIQTAANLVYAARNRAHELDPDREFTYDMQPVMLEIERNNRSKGRYVTFEDWARKAMKEEKDG